MKLLNYSSLQFLGVLLLLLSIWAVIFYFEINDEIYDSLDGSLENQKELVIHRIQEDRGILDNTGLFEGYTRINEVSYQEYDRFEENYSDTLIYLEEDDEFEPVRLLEDVFELDGAYYKIQVSTSMVEEDDLVESLLISLAWLYLGLIISILVLNNVVMRKVWRPFYSLLEQLNHFSIERDEEITFEATRIREFRLLNKRVEQLIKKAVESYKNQKHFIENASHELQTPLAISINKLELMVENHDLDHEQLEALASVLRNLERLTRLNKSLLLLSKIENQQFHETTLVDFNVLVKQIIEEFGDLSEYQESSIELSQKATIQFQMNPDLAVILISNLVKNALLHGIPGESVKIDVLPSHIRIWNAGATVLHQSTLFTRFKDAGKDSSSTGLGLAISKAITSRYDMELNYQYKEGHQFVIVFPENKLKTKNKIDYSGV